MTRIDPGGALLSLLRGELRSLRGGAESIAKPTGGARTRKRETGAAAAGRGPQALATSIARRIAAIETTDPDRRAKAFRGFLEGLILHEWGPAILTDPAFPRLIARIEAQMSQREDLRALIDEAAAQLLAAR